jgi:hypothetical protein
MISRIPNGPHFAIVTECSVTIPGDERSRTHHGYDGSSAVGPLKLTPHQDNGAGFSDADFEQVDACQGNPPRLTSAMQEANARYLSRLKALNGDS